MKVLFINNDGAGFADYVEIQPNTSIQSFCDQRCSGKSTNYLIRVNRQPRIPFYRKAIGFL